MLRKLVLLVLIAAAAFLVMAAVTPDDTPDKYVVQEKYYCRYNAMDIDSIAGNDASEFSHPFPVNLFGMNQPFPDAIAFDIAVEAGATQTLTAADTLMLRLWASNATDSTNLVSAAMSWRPIHLNGNEDTVALGPTDDDLATATYDAHGVYTLSAAQLASAASFNWFMLDIDFSTGGATADDTCGVRIDMIQRYTGWITQ
jgi:hypothetical protein